MSQAFVKRIDDLGRVAIPKELRRELHIREGDKLHIELKDEETVSIINTDAGNLMLP